MGAALFAPRQALIDAITVWLVRDDENPAVGPSCRAGKERHAGQNG